ncbi:QWRF motif-containing protein 2-like protein [Cinnamomum micranthum f. kanehirae]|uniref:QWRF motif-containing protein 2-like protein n=1 Tax=Cinnamomum micranthum f. kanehirae TaxID=337451 RepID=A0A3S3MFI3_9MAGN|nr:QWRF motif-containing protein 2-like protein [Cinnamomum micranthum f. kanehirae]
MMVAAISATPSQNNPKTPHLETHHHNPTRPPLLPSEKDNGLSRRPKTREVTSRYMSSFSSSSSSSTSSSSASRRLPSPIVSRPAAIHEPSAVKRSQSVEQRRSVASRPTTPLPDSKLSNGAGETPVAAKMLWTSTRRLSVSFQGESFSLPISKVKAAPPIPHPNSNNGRKPTPERRRASPVRGKIDDVGGDQLENSKSFEQHRWPARARQLNCLTRSLDCSGERSIVGAPRSVIRALQQSMIDEGRRVSYDSRALRQSMIDEGRCVSFDGRLSIDLGNAESEKSVQVGIDADSDNLTASDSESVSSSSNSGMQEFSGTTRPRGAPRGISVPARFWQETNSRLRRLQEPGSPLTTNGSRSTMVASKPIQSKKALSDSSQLFSPRTGPVGRALSSPLRGPIRLSSPSKPMVSSSPSRGMLSPSQVRSSLATSANSQSSNVPSILSFAADVRRGKMGENKIEDAHMLRLLYNRHLQWRFVNARADSAMSLQRLTAEKNLYNAWITTSKLRDSVTIRRIRLLLLRQNLKLTTILKGQMSYLEEWTLLDRDHLSSLTGAIEALKASTLRLPVISGARADIEDVKDAVGSAVDVMQAMASSICSLLSKVEGTNSLVTDVSSLALQEQALLTQCKDLLSTIAAMQVEECSIRTHLLQLRCTPNRTQL